MCSSSSSYDGSVVSCVTSERTHESAATGGLWQAARTLSAQLQQLGALFGHPRVKLTRQLIHGLSFLLRRARFGLALRQPRPPLHVRLGDRDGVP